MKTAPLQYAGKPMFAEPSCALPSLFQLLHYDARPECFTADIRSKEADSLLNDVKLHTDNLIKDLFSFTCYHHNVTINSNIQNCWCALNTLLDIAYGYIKKYPALKPVYQPVLDTLIGVYDFLDMHFKHLYPVYSKMPDIILDKNIVALKAGYHQLMQAHDNNSMLRAVLHPVWEVIKYTGKGNNTFQKVNFAFHLTGRVKLWNQHKGSYDQLCSIAISMNVSSRAFLQYLARLGKNTLASYADARSKQKQLHNWQQQCHEALWNNIQASHADSYSANGQPVAALLTQWMKEQKEFLNLTDEEIDELVRLEIAEDLTFFCWHTRLAIEAGFYKSKIVSQVIRSLGKVIATENKAAPSMQTLEKLAKGSEIPWQTKDKLADYYNRCLNGLFKLEEKGTRPPKRNTKTNTAQVGKVKPKARGK